MAPVTGYMNGLIEGVQIQDVIQLLALNGRTGKLTMASHDRSVHGVLKLVKGAIYNAECGDLIGEDAAYELLALDAGRYAFIPEYIQTERLITLSTQSLVMDAAKFSDSRRRLSDLFPNPHAVPYALLAGEERFKGVKLYEDDALVARQINGYKDFKEIAVAVGVKPLVAMQTAAVLLTSNLIGIAEPKFKVKVDKRRSFLFRAKHITLAMGHHDQWRSMPPYESGVGRVRMVDVANPVEYQDCTVQFDDKMPSGTVLVPDHIMDSIGMQVGDEVWVCPAHPAFK